MSMSDSEIYIKSKKNEVDNSCPICYNYMLSSVKLKCQHKLCLECFIISIDNINIKCPLCRDVIDEAKPILIRYNKLLEETKFLLEIIDSLKIKIKSNEEIIESYKDLLKQKEKKIEEYKDILLEMNINNIKLLNNIIEKLDKNI